jgi:DNA mismatch repair ATPase MutL
MPRRWSRTIRSAPLARSCTRPTSLAESRDGIVLVDAHAAHERLVYEKLKAGLERDGIATQPLLIPDVVELPAGNAEAILAQAEGLAKLGLVLEPFGANAVLVRETPAMLGVCDAAGLVKDLAEEFAEAGSLRRALKIVSTPSPPPWPAMGRCAPGGD